ncbi:DUF819 family protein [Agaribacter marinus]|uniref:DUF819 domain-containing protein n=1 Tax=Virgibacillus salarius TaxID=447199 RepID=A0A941DV75_9BACI|nr:DUF819 family protein [Virgibacillus salarius]MBR7795719.1 DUF819 domain-containing protein [Virgibacillus salarius]NAZ08432.1 DUF819 family protein [Agaribacter marinus]
MITDGFFYIAVLVALAALMVGIENKFSSNRFLKFIPGIVLIYIGAAFLQTIGLFDNEATAPAYSIVKNALLPAMLMMMLLKCDIRSIIKLGPRMLGGYFVAVISIILGFAIVYLIFNHFYVADTWRAFGALAGSWTGGSANMVALQDILQVPENIFGYVLMMDTINYAVWVMFMFWLVPFAGAFNRWTKADTTIMDNGLAEDAGKMNDMQGTEFKHMMYLLGIGLLVSALATLAGNHLPALGDVFSSTTWTILIASVIGLILGQTRISKIPGALDVSNVMLYIIVALIASQSDFSQIAQAPIYLISGFLIMLIHLVIMLLLGKLFKYDLFTLGIASLANIGGMASAPMLAASYSRSLIPVGVVMALIGSFLGTYFGMFIGKILEIL